MMTVKEIAISNKKSLNNKKSHSLKRIKINKMRILMLKNHKKTININPLIRNVIKWD